MKIVVDTNVILDVLCSRPEFADTSSRVWKYCETERVEGYISALSAANIVYILRKELTPQKTEQMIRQLTMIFNVVDLRSSDLIVAAGMFASDYEDALQMCQANRIGADYIVTRNIRDFKDSKVPALMPAQFLEKV